MQKSESLINNLLIEVDSLSFRIINIQKAYCNTIHKGLRKRLCNECKNLSQRLNEIFSIAKLLKNRSKENISFSSLLFEKCERTIAQIKFEKNLFFL
tara:strand:+ start:608 stop:898 length:291 start_codon:yes stop_codon:yes gene_type:complete